MGTAAVFAIRSGLNPPRHFRTIIGMTSDGFPDNLKYIASEFKNKMAELRVKTKAKRRQWDAVQKVMEAVVAANSDWLFLDDERNAEWVSNSAIYDPGRDTISIFSGQFGTHMSTCKLSHLIPLLK